MTPGNDPFHVCPCHDTGMMMMMTLLHYNSELSLYIDHAMH